MFQVGCQINPIAITLHFSAPIGPFTHNCPKIFASAPLSYFKFIPYVTQFGPAWLGLTYIILSDALSKRNYSWVFLDYVFLEMCRIVVEVITS